MFVHNNAKSNPYNFDAKSSEALFIGYSSYSKASHVYGKRTLMIEESMHVIFYEYSFSSGNIDIEKWSRWL